MLNFTAPAPGASVDDKYAAGIQTMVEKVRNDIPEGFTFLWGELCAS